jgi:hypothetical protein
MNFAGQIRDWPKKVDMAAMLCRAGLTVSEGRYSIRIDDYAHFVFQEYGGDLGEPSFDVDAGTLAELSRQAQQVSLALTTARLAHRFEIYDGGQNLVAYYHYDWPRDVQSTA